jgi:hypothetical protein
MSGQELQIGESSSNPSFVQQGQVDWVTFANSTITGSIAVMQRLSAAGVQPVTVAGGLALGSRFTLGKRGQKNMDVTLKKLSGVFGYDKVLYFGFGYRSFVNILIEKKVGVNLVALCACLVDMHGIPIAADVLASLWKLEGFPDEFEPSISQFNALITACSGVVAATTFGQTGDMMLGDLRKLRQDKSELTGLPEGSISNAGDIAKALHGVFQVVRGSIEQINVIGGPNCAFIGAVAHWLFDLTVYIQDESGALIFQSTLQPEDAQVKIQYSRTDQVSTELQVASTTYILGDHRQMLIHHPWENRLHLTVRTSWDGCLERIFGNAFQQLISVPRLFGEFLGSAARIYAALAQAETDVANFSRQCFADFIDSTYGYGFIKSTKSIFPELGRIKDLESAMQNSMRSSSTEALSKIELVTSSLTRLCECEDCSTSIGGNRDQIGGEETTGHCVVTTVITITYLIRLVAGLECDPMLNPCINGMQEIYRKCWSQRRNQQIYKHQGLGLHLSSTESMEVSLSITPSYLLADVECLFTGYYPTTDEIRRNNYRTAFSNAGICCFLEALGSLSSTAANLRRIHVMPGHIQRGDREYTSVWDCAPTNLPDLPEAKLDPPSVTPLVDIRDDNVDIKIIVTEVSGGGQLIFYYRAKVQGATVLIRPGMLTQRVLERTGLIICNRRTCNTELFYPCRVVREGWKVAHDDLGIGNTIARCLIWPFRETDLGRCVAIEITQSTLYVRSGECLACCTKAAISQSRKHGESVTIV